MQRNSRDEISRGTPEISNSASTSEQDLTELEQEEIEGGSTNTIVQVNLKLLKQLQSLNVEDLLIKIFDNKDNFESFVDTDNKNDEEILILVKILAMVCASSFTNVKSVILSAFLKDKFLLNLYKVIGNLSTHEELCCRWGDALRFWNDLIVICNNICDLSGHFLHLLGALLQTLKQTLPIFETTHKTLLSTQVKESIEEIEARLRFKQSEEERKKTQRQQDPPDDFRQIPIYPTSSNDTSFLRPNIVEGSYKSVDHYLDTQFRLLREDCLRPLKNAIQRSHSKVKKPLEKVFVQKNVVFLSIEPVNEYYCYRVLLSSNRKKEVKTKPGSLVCFSRDQFTTIICGRIYDRFVKDLKLGKNEVVVEFQQRVSVELHQNYTMLTCVVYLEPYLQALKSLQNMSTRNFPMEKYIVRLDLRPKPPKQGLLNSYRYDLFSEISSHNFDESQAAVFKSALTEELAIIQGPPGSGKTYLGLRIVETFLKNRLCSYRGSQILVICNSTYALDQFLEGVLQYTDKIVRVGAKSSKDKLNKFALKGLRGVKNASLWEKLKRSNETAAKIKDISKLLVEIGSYEGVIDFKRFEEVEAGTWFYHASSGAVVDWLMEGREKIADLLVEDEVDYPVWTEDGASENASQFSIVSLKSLSDEIRKLEGTARTQNGIAKKSTCEKIIDLKKKHQYLAMRLSKAKQMRHVIPEKPKSTNLVHPKKMNCDDRWNLYFYWLNILKNSLIPTLKSLYGKFQSTYKTFEELKTLENVESLRDADVIGMTVTMAARHRMALHTLRCPVVIVEEAAQILEAHVVTSLTENCSHLILIGDRQQLRPRTVDANIENEYKLGISLFERILMNSPPNRFSALQMQHRMSPEISSLLLPMYPSLENHESTSGKRIRGIEKSVFFINHQNKDTGGFNELNFFIYLAKYLILNGYKTSDITIITTDWKKMCSYRDQVADYEDLKGLEVALLDHYQGEECNIILLSFGDDQDHKTAGNLSTENRICVALSRAKQGLYISGNMTQLCQENHLWIKIQAALQDQNAIGPKLPLRCRIHPHIVTYVESDAEFMAIPDGGCTQKCDAVLKCGHQCKEICHVQKRDHQHYRCEEACIRLLCDQDPSHRCRKKCYEKCGLCTYLISKSLPCGHEIKVKCYLYSESYKCSVIVETELPCGHIVDKKCYQDAETYVCRKQCTKYPTGCTVKVESHKKCRKLCFEECEICMFPVKKQRTACSHIVEVPCHLNVNIIKCVEPCTKFLACGHGCTKLCHEECGDCNVKIKKTYPVCGHSVKVRCSEEPDRKFCAKKCPVELACGHLCNAKCNEPCTTTCMAMVDCSVPTECGHSVSQINCHKFHISNFQPNVLPAKYCTKPCDALLVCGHPCTGNCNECYQGRFHKRCEEKCTSLLVCNHENRVSCKEVLSPCPSKCLYRCQHNSCSKGCNEICTPCKKKCPRSCSHQQCTEKCGDICSVPPCKESCPKKLKCGHDCIGFCGDPCPTKCLICDTKYFDSNGFGNERYVLLNDCQHIVASSRMEELMNQDSDNLEFKVCPTCGVPVINTQRYSDFAKRTISYINEIKRQVNGTAEDNNENCYKLQEQFFGLKQKSQKLKSDFTKIKITLEALESNFAKAMKNKQKTLNKSVLETYSSKLNIIEHILTNCQIFVEAPEKFFISQINFILNILKQENNYFQQQEINDLSSEVAKYIRMLQFCKIKMSNAVDMEPSATEEFQKIETSLTFYFRDFKPFSKEDDNHVVKLLKQLTTSSTLNVLDIYELQISRHWGYEKKFWAVDCRGRVVKQNID